MNLLCSIDITVIFNCLDACGIKSLGILKNFENNFKIFTLKRLCLRFRCGF